MTFRSDHKMSGVAGVVVALATLFYASPLWAGEADVLKADMRLTSSGSFTISATILHDDAGWDHYADAFEIVAPDGSLLATRTLLHPHVNEQPFTRSIVGVDIPSHMSHVIIRAHDTIHGYGGKAVKLDIVR